MNFVALFTHTHTHTHTYTHNYTHTYTHPSHYFLHLPVKPDLERQFSVGDHDLDSNLPTAFFYAKAPLAQLERIKITAGAPLIDTARAQPFLSLVACTVHTTLSILNVTLSVRPLVRRSYHNMHCCPCPSASTDAYIY